MSFTFEPRRLTADETMVFIHIPKTAGTTFRPLIRDYFDEPLTFNEMSVPDQSHRGDYQLKHRLFHDMDITAYRLVYGHWDWGILRHIERPVPITFLRDPVHRLLSNYHFLRRNLDAEWNKIGEHMADMTFGEWLADPLIHTVFQNMQARIIAGEYWTEVENPLAGDALLQTALDHLNQCAFVGLAERMADSLLLLAYSFGWQPVTTFHSRNQSPQRTAADRLEPKHLEKIIHDYCAVDIQLYEHSKALYQRRLLLMLHQLYHVTLTPEQQRLLDNPPQPPYQYGENTCKTLFSPQLREAVARHMQEQKA